MTTKYEAGAKQGERNQPPVNYYDPDYVRGYLDAAYSRVSDEHPFEYMAISIILELTGYSKITQNNAAEAVRFYNKLQRGLKDDESSAKC